MPASASCMAQMDFDAVASRLAKQATQERMERLTSDPVQLTLFGRPHSASPNAILRSALFRARKSTAAAVPVHDKMVACLTGPNLSYDIRFSGLELDQGDLDVWEAVLYSTSTTPLGTVSRVSRRGLLRRLGRNPKKGERLHAQLEKPSGAVVRIREKRGHQVYGYSGSLCSVDWAESLVSGAAKYAISIPPTMAELFGSSVHLRELGRTERASSGSSRAVAPCLLLVPPLPAAMFAQEAPRALRL